MRRGLEDGSRACLDVGPRLVEAGAASLTLHPRSARQMYTGSADHRLTAELVERVPVPVIASGDITSRARAQAVIATTGAAAVMVGRAAQGNPWVLAEMIEEQHVEPSREEIVAEVEQRLLIAAPGAADVLERLEQELPSGEEVELDLPISIYGGG